jgi:hypothetical protein
MVNNKEMSMTTRQLTEDELYKLALYAAQRDAVMRLNAGLSPLTKTELDTLVDKSIAKFRGEFVGTNLNVPQPSIEQLEKVLAALEQLGENQKWLDLNT